MRKVIRPQKGKPPCNLKEFLWTLRASAFSPAWLLCTLEQASGRLCICRVPAFRDDSVHLVCLVALSHLCPQRHFCPVDYAGSGTAMGNRPRVAGHNPGSHLYSNFVLLPPYFSLSFSSSQTILETGAFLAFGLTICLVVSRIEYARSEAELARQRAEQLAHQLERERTQAARQASELEAVFAAIADGVYVYDAHGRMKRANPAGQAFNPYTSQDDYLRQPPRTHHLVPTP